MLGKINNLGKDLNRYSLETVMMFYEDAKASGYKLIFMTFNFKLFNQAVYGIFDQIFSSILIFGINLYFAQKAYFNEIGILALVFASFGFAQVLQQALLEKPFLIKKNIFSLKIIAKRLALIFTLLLISVFIIFISETNSSSQETFSEYFILPWICLGVVHLLFILTRIISIYKQTKCCILYVFNINYFNFYDFII